MIETDECALQTGARHPAVGRCLSRLDRTCAFLATARKAVKAERKAARGDSDREYFSDGGVSTTSSMRKLARTADAQLSLRPQGGGAPWGQARGDRGSSSR